MGIFRLDSGRIITQGPSTSAASDGTTGLAKINNSRLIFFSHYRTMDEGQYVIELSEPFTDFPSGDDLAGTTLINRRIEAATIKAPDQYLWVHRRFKTRAEGIQTVLIQEMGCNNGYETVYETIA